MNAYFLNFSFSLVRHHKIATLLFVEFPTHAIDINGYNNEALDFQFRIGLEWIANHALKVISMQVYGFRNTCVSTFLMVTGYYDAFNILTIDTPLCHVKYCTYFTFRDMHIQLIRMLTIWVYHNRILFLGLAPDYNVVVCPRMACRPRGIGTAYYREPFWDSLLSPTLLG